MAKRLNTDSAAKQVTAALQPVVDSRVTAPSDPRQAAPNPTRMSPEMERALGINQPRKQS